MKSALVWGGGGFIGSHVVKRLKSDGYWVKAVDLKYPEVFETHAADMGGAGYLFTGEHDADVMHNSVSINLNILTACQRRNNKRILYASSARVYPEYNQLDPDAPVTRASSTFPAAPDSEYGWEKLFSERLSLAFSRNHGIDARIARYHSIFGPEGTWTGGCEKAPAALCRKVAEARDGSAIEIWGDGKQTRSFLFIGECVEGTIRLMRSDFAGPVNIGSDQMMTINDLAAMIIELSGKRLSIKHIPGPLDVRGHNSDNNLMKERLGWAPSQPLKEGIKATYAWIARQVAKRADTGDL